MHLSPANQSGTGSTNVVFSYDANPGATRTGTLTIAGQTLTLTQAGSTYISAAPLTTFAGSALSAIGADVNGVAVDGAGNVYIADTANSAIEEWTVADNTVTTLVSSGLNTPSAVAVDGAGNVYIADTFNNAIKEWNAATKTVTTLVSSGLRFPLGVAVDGVGNVYIADSYNGAIKQWSVASDTVTTLSSGWILTEGVAVDAVGNVYFDVEYNNLYEWMAANSNVTTIPSVSGTPQGLAVDGAGNVYVADPLYGAIEEWNAASNIMTTLCHGLAGPSTVAVDGTGNVYIGTTTTAIQELQYAFVDPTPKLESLAAGSDSFPVVLPSTENLLPPFAPTPQVPWLAVNGITNGVVSFGFTASTSDRTGAISLLGQTIVVAQGSFNSSAGIIGTSALLEGPAAGSGSVVLAVASPTNSWTAAANAAWLHLALANQVGLGSANVIFSYDANPGATRTGTLNIAGQTLTLTQAGSTYVEAGTLTTLVSSGLNAPFGLTLDGSGNVYIADTENNAIKEWTVTNNNVTTMVSSGLSYPAGLALDGSGNVYIANLGGSEVDEWIAASNTLTTLVSSDLYYPYGVAVDGSGNVYIADTYDQALKEWIPASNTLITLVSSGLTGPYDVALDAAGNVYIADSYNPFNEYSDDNNHAIEVWSPVNQSLTTLVSSGLENPQGVAVDGSGNVHIADVGGGYAAGTILEWVAASNTLITLVSGLEYAEGVAVDTSGNVYMTDVNGNVVEELPYAFVDPTPKSESAGAGSDSLPTVLPATENLLPPFAPTSDQSWLTMTGITNGVVSFSFTANTGLSRTAHITLLGQTIPITQAGVTPPTLTSVQTLANGACLFCFTNTAGASFTVLSTTDVSLPLSNWVVAGTATIISPGLFQFTTPPMTNDPQRFYTVRSP